MEKVLKIINIDKIVVNICETKVAIATPATSIFKTFTKYKSKLDLTITDLQDKVAHLNKVAEILINLNNSDPENRKLAKYDYAKMNLTSAIKLEQVEKEIEENQRFMTKWIDDYEYKVRRLENFINILDNTRNQNVTKLERETKSV